MALLVGMFIETHSAIGSGCCYATKALRISRDSSSHMYFHFFRQSCATEQVLFRLPAHQIFSLVKHHRGAATMEVHDNGSGEPASVATSVEPLDDMAPLQQALEENTTEKRKPRPAIVRLWNKEDVE